MAQENQTTKEDKIRLTIKEVMRHCEIQSLDIHRVKETETYSIWLKVNFVNSRELAELNLSNYAIHPRENAVMVHGYFKED